MTGDRNRGDRKPPLWDFALRAWRRPELAAAALELQDRHGADVALILACLFAGAECGVVLDPSMLDRMETVSRPWRVQVIEPLRAARRAAASFTDAPVSPDLAGRLRELEVSAEQTAIERLAAMLGALPGGGNGRAAARSNLEAYLGTVPAGLIDRLIAGLPVAG